MTGDDLLRDFKRAAVLERRRHALNTLRKVVGR